MKYSTKAIVTVPAWADALHEGMNEGRNTIKTTAEAYAYVPLIFRATRLICNSLVSVPVKIYKGDNEVDWPFPEVSLRSLLWKSQAAMSLTGANFIEKMPRRMSKKIGGLQWVNPTTMSPPKLIKKEDGSIDFEFSQKRNPAEKWNLSTMMYMREFSLADDVGPGDASATVALGNAKLLHYMSRFASTFFETGAMPITVLQIEGLVDPDEAQRIEGFFKKAATRIKNAWNVLALNRAIEPKMISQPLKDLVMPDLADEARRAVADAFDMHPSLLEEAPNRATATEHRLSLYQDSVEPKAIMLAEEFNRQLLKPMGLEMIFAFDEMDIYQEDETVRAQALGQVVTAITTDPAVASWAMSVLGYDLTDEQQADLDKLIKEKEKQKEEAQRRMEEQTAQAQQQPGQPAQPGRQSPPSQANGAQAQPAKWSEDLSRWQRKALRVLNEAGSACCPFDSDLIPADMRSSIEQGLEDCVTPDEVKAVFGKFTAQAVTETPAPAYHTDDLKALAGAINSLAQADSNQAVMLELIKAVSGKGKEEDMQVIIHNPASVEMTDREAIKAIQALTEKVSQSMAPQVTVNVPEAPAPQVTVKMPDTQAPQVVVNVPQGPAPVVNVAPEITVPPAEVTVNVPKATRERQTVKRNRDGLITETDTEITYKE